MNIISRWIRSLYRKAVLRNLITPEVIVLMDGGICSQMHQYLLGLLFSEKGYKVSYDLSFYDEWGQDLTYRFARNFDLLKAFPYLSLRRASEFKISIYKERFPVVTGNNTGARTEDYSFMQRRPPVYLGGYYHWYQDIWLASFRRVFHIDLSVLDAENRVVCSEIAGCRCSVGVHVRRGDMTVELPVYGKPATTEYFRRAVKYMDSKLQDPVYYFFSDEPSWVADTLLPQLGLGGEDVRERARIIDINGSDKGYMDLFLIAQCAHQITSKGTIGKYGALLKDCPDKIVVMCDDVSEYPYRQIFNNPVFL